MPSKEWLREYHTQKKEHPTLPDWAVRRVATDHVPQKHRIKQL